MSQTALTMPIISHEFVTEAVPEHKIREPELIDKRACLFGVTIPPDHLNPLVPPLSISQSSGLTPPRHVA